MNITRHEGKYYKEVKRVAKVGELIKIVDAVLSAGRYKGGSILLVDKKCQCGCGSAYCLFDGDSRIILQCEYVTLEPLTVMTDEPHPEIAEGSTFVVVDDRGCQPDFPAGKTVTLTSNDCSITPYFDNRVLLWSRFSPLNIIYKDNVKTFSVDGETEIKRKEIDMKVTYCEHCGHVMSVEELPKKRVYTAEQIQEAKDIVYRLIFNVWETNGKAIRIIRQNGDCTYATLYSVSQQVGGMQMKREKFAYTKCSPNDEWNDDIGRMVAICKLTGEKLPEWILKDGE